jgi:outer membrane protein OmpA-like peptidoglycan-associated protein
LEQFEHEAPAARVSVQPKLCLYQLANQTSHRNHFHHQATGTARRIGAIGNPDASNCVRRIGPTPYATGADIINAIRAAWSCTGKKPIKSVHIFGHSGSTGVYGNTFGSAGLYQNSTSLDAASRAAGARTISDIPTDVLANDVIFVLHGCNQAEGCNVQGEDDNFAQSLLQHLAGSLTNPRVYGHYNFGCAGRNNSWCLYSKTVPKGRAHSAPTYVDPGGCATPSREVEVEMETEHESGPCDRLQTFKIDNYGRGVSQLSSSQQALLTRIKSAIRGRARRCGGISIVEIRGHSSTEGPAGQNRNLAQVRANVVKSALSSTLGRARVFATSKGEEQPLIRPDNTDQKQRRNRRVEIFVM